MDAVQQFLKKNFKTANLHKLEVALGPRTWPTGVCILGVWRLNNTPLLRCSISHYEILSHNAQCTIMVHDGAVQHGHNGAVQHSV